MRAPIPWALAPSVALVGCLTAAVVVARGAGDTADDVFARLQEARVARGSGALERRPQLDGVARERARLVASLPHERRLQSHEPIGDGLRAAGVRLFRRATVHVDLNRGYTDPASAFLRTWRGYEASWSTAMDPAHDAAGLAVEPAADGWLVLAAVFVQDEQVPEDLPAVERGVVEAINTLRTERGLRALDRLEPLAQVARRHSEDMARRSYFRHRSPEGHEAAERVLAAGLAHRALAENIYRARGVRDPVGGAVESWMNSRGHRENILTERFRQTGVGVAVDEEGQVYVTQLFLDPP
jgi:uncharacterized protein YkwD